MASSAPEHGAARGAGRTAALRLLVVTDRRALPGGSNEAALVDCLERAARAAPAGALGVIVRERDLPARRQLGLVRALLAAVRPYGASVLVSERLDVALAAEADGVHLPAPPVGLPAAEARALASRLLVGVSTHSVAEVEAAARASADYVTFGPVYPTPSKLPYGPPVGEEALAAAARVAAVTGLRLFALGGVDATNAARCRALGVDGVACIRAVLGAGDPEAAVGALIS